MNNAAATDIKGIIKALRDELALQTRHCKLLEAQERALLACDRVKVCALQEEHAQLVVQLAAQDEARREALQDNTGKALTFSALKADASEPVVRALETLEGSLRPLLQKVQALTSRNQILIQNELEYFAFSLDLFVEAGRAACSGYGGYGSLGSRILLDRRA